MPKPDLIAVPPFYHRYINLVTEENLPAAFAQNTVEMLSFFQALPAEKWGYRYAAGKWTVREMVQHLIDTERIFAYRALCIARGEKASLPGFDEESYAQTSKADGRTAEVLVEELAVVRRSIELLFASFNAVQLDAVGVANNNSISVNAIGYIVPGHAKHHLNVLHERYLL